MASIDTLFVTKVYRAEMTGAKAESRNAELEAACLSIAEDDEAGQRWCAKHGYPGYTSYASLNDLPWRVPVFGDLLKELDKPCDGLRQGRWNSTSKAASSSLDSLWINILPPGGIHTSHIHPHSVVSGTYYVTIPDGASALKLEDPRLGFMMAAPPRKAKAKPENRQFAYMKPQPRHRAALGKLAAPRGAPQRGRERAHQRELQLLLAVGPSGSRQAQLHPTSSSVARTPETSHDPSPLWGGSRWGCECYLHRLVAGAPTSTPHDEGGGLNGAQTSAHIRKRLALVLASRSNSGVLPDWANRLRLAVSRSKRSSRLALSRTWLCAQPTATMRSPRVTGATRCRLVES